MRPVTESAAGSSLRRITVPLLLAYPVLAIAGALSHRMVFSLTALLLLLTIWLLPRLLDGSVWVWSSWLLGVLTVLALAAAGYANALLEAVPLLIIAFLAGWFGSSLRAGREARIARFIRVLEGADRLALPGVERYARRVTAFWAGLLALQALVLAFLLWHGLFGAHDLPRWALVYQHVGGYLLIGVAFGAEYAWRRWHLRHLDHPGMRAQTAQLLQRWPQLLHGQDVTR